MADDSLHLINLADVEPKPVDFLIYPYIPRGKLTLLQGDPGQGKTMFALKIAADISAGRSPFGEERGSAPVVYQSAEDGLADTIVKRLELMAPHMENIYCIDESQAGLSLSDERLEQAIQAIRPALVIIDPLQAYLGSDVDMHRANQVRPVLSRIARMAERYNCSIVFIVHMSKMAQPKALYRGLGSIDIVAAARSLLVVGCNPHNPDQKVLAHAKSSLAPAGMSIAFHLNEEQGVVIEGYSELTAEQILGPAKNKRNPMALAMAENIIRQCMNDGGIADLAQIKEAAALAGISERTLSRAKESLGIRSKTMGFSDKQTWWLAPDANWEEFMQLHL